MHFQYSNPVNGYWPCSFLSHNYLLWCNAGPLVSVLPLENQCVYLSALRLCIRLQLTYRCTISQMIILPCEVQTLWDFVFLNSQILENRPQLLCVLWVNATWKEAVNLKFLPEAPTGSSLLISICTYVLHVQLKLQLLGLLDGFEPVDTWDGWLKKVQL